MTKAKRGLKYAISLSLVITILFSMFITSGIGSVLAASSSTYKNELWMLCDYDHALLRGTRVDIDEASDAAPFAHTSGTAYLPLPALLKYTSSTATRDGNTVTVTRSSGASHSLTIDELSWSGGEFLLPPVDVDGVVYLSILSANAIFGTKSYYEANIGCVVLYEGYSSSSGLTTMVATLGNLLFERPSMQTISSDLLSSATSGEHPSLLATSETFDSLREVFADPNSEADSFYTKLRNLMSSCLAAFNGYFLYNDVTGEVTWKSEETRLSLRQPYYIYDENGNRLVGVKTYTYVDEKGNQVTLEPGGSGRGDGYDFGGRSAPDKHTERMKNLAFLYQMTGEKRFADALYLIGIELSKWEHWGEGHFLNCADASVDFAVALDWSYHAFDDEPQKRDELAAILYEKGMMKGYYAIVCDSLYKQGSPSRIDLSASSASKRYQYGSEPSLSGKQATYLSISYTAGSSGWRTINRDNNWQTVCGSGMIVAALFLSDYEEYRKNATFVIEQYLLSLERCLGQYAPDGSYIESPGYWGYGTNTLMVTLGALISRVGKTYGYDDIVGLYDSFYYTIGIADGEYRMWNYHDSGEGTIDYTSFYLASRIWQDATIAGLRDKMVFENGNSMSVMDAIYYDPSLSAGADYSNVALDYNFAGIDTATFRSAHGEGEIFTGLHVGPNSVTHGDMDCGNFALTMGGIKWIADPGSENYNVSGFWDSGANGKRYKLYAKSIEGHSTVMIRNDSSIPLGQRYTTYSTDYAKIDAFYSDVNGGYAISDMTYEYGQYCTTGKRGVLLTNSRSTVVLQDEIQFSRATNAAIVLNLQNYLFLSNGGKTITAKAATVDGKQVSLRVTLISDNPSLRFRIMNNNYNTENGKFETVFPHTYTKTNNNDPLAKDPVQRVIVEANGVTELNVAMVFQILGHEDEIVPYSYTSMDNWKTETDEWVKEANKDINYGGEVVVPNTPYRQFYNANEKLTSAFEKNDYALVNDILRETIHYLDHFDHNNKSVLAEAEKYNNFRKRFNQVLRAMNAAFLEEIQG